MAPSQRLRAHDGSLTLLGITLITFLGMGMPWYAMGIFFTPLVDDFGWGRAAYSIATSIHVVLSTLGSAPVGWLVDRWGPRRVMLVSAAASGLCWILIGQVGRMGEGAALWQTCLLYGLLGLASAGLGTVPVSDIVVRRFAGQRGRTMGLSIVGAGLPGVILVPLSAPFIAAHGWRALALLLGGLVLVVCIPSILWLLGDDTPEGIPVRRPGRRRPVPGISTAQALRTLPFWSIGVAYLLTQFGSVAAQMHAIPFLMDCGLSRQTASDIWGVLALAGIVGKVGLGYAADRIAAHWIAVLSFGLQAAALAAALAWPGLGGAWLFAVLSGLGLGGQTVARPLLVERYFGLAAFGTISGAVALFTLPGVAAGQSLAGYLYDLTGSYAQAYTLFVGTLLVGMVALLPLASRAVKAPWPTPSALTPLDRPPQSGRGLGRP